MQLNNAICFDIKGIKCDNVSCDYRDMEVDFDPEKFLNAPCPKCGSNLFTREDYDSMHKLISFSNEMNKLYVHDVGHVVTRAELKMNGSGNIEIGEIK